MRWSSAATNRPAAPVKEPHAHAMACRYLRKLALDAVESPHTCHDATILAAVAVADHHLLYELTIFTGSACKAALDQRMRQVIIHYFGGAVEVIDGLEERHDFEWAIETSLVPLE